MGFLAGLVLFVIVELGYAVLRETSTLPEAPLLVTSSAYPPLLATALPYPPPTLAPPADAYPLPTLAVIAPTVITSPTATATATPTAPRPAATPTPTTLPSVTPTRTLRLVSADETREPIFIEALRRKKPAAGDIEIVGVWQDATSFTRSYIRYRSEGQRVTGYINIPKGRGPFPAIVMNHGYFLQERYTPGLGTRREADYLAERGYVVAVSDFRSYAGSEAGQDGGGHFGVDWVYDSMNLIEAVKRLPQVDPTRIGLWGHSTGGLNALQSTVTRQDIHATVVVSTMSADMTQTLVFLRNWRPWVADEVVRRFGTPQARPENWARMSPINYLKDASGPIQVHHGLADDEVTPEYSAKLWAAMQAAGVQGEYYTYPGADHLWQQLAPWRLMMERTAMFYDQYLKREGDTR